MTVSAGFIDQVTELLQGLGHITVRRMFGGAAAYCDGTVFALLDEDCLYFKTDDAGRAAFEAEGMGPFSYETKNGPAQIASFTSGRATQLRSAAARPAPERRRRARSAPPSNQNRARDRLLVGDFHRPR
jgi:TfoX/Sxy family transcriptional regulator of competence genes